MGSFAISQGSVVTPSSNYAISYTGANLSITPATLSITANAQTKAYGVNDPSLTYLNSGLVNTTVDGLAINDSGLTISGNLARTTAGTSLGEQVGSFAISQGSVVTPSSNYAISYTGANLSITPATLAITANAQTKAYGVNDPSFTYMNSGLINTTVDGLLINDSGLTIAGSLVRTTAGTFRVNKSVHLQLAKDLL